MCSLQRFKETETVPVLIVLFDIFVSSARNLSFGKCGIVVVIEKMDMKSCPGEDRFLPFQKEAFPLTFGFTVSKIQRKNAFLGQNSPIPTNLFFIFLFHFLLFVKTVFTEHRGITWSFIHWILVFLSRCTSCMCWWWTCRSSNKFWV